MKDEVDNIIELLPKEQWNEVMNQDMCEIEPVFMGFTDIYKNLSEIIPKHFTVVDLGCAYNPQCFYFTEHKKYIAVDISSCKKFKSSNCEIFNISIQEFIDEHLKDLDLDETFMICAYVPNWNGHDIKKVVTNFKNMFTFYPHGGHLHDAMNEIIKSKQ